MSSLTEKQKARLRVIDDVLVQPAAWWGTLTDKSLLRRGLIERCDTTKQLAPQISFTTHLCRLTDEGRAIMQAKP